MRSLSKRKENESRDTNELEKFSGTIERIFVALKNFAIFRLNNNNDCKGPINFKIRKKLCFRGSE